MQEYAIKSAKNMVIPFFNESLLVKDYYKDYSFLSK